MKTRLFKFLIKYKIVQRGYLNPLFLWGFLLLTPSTMYLFNKDYVAEKSGYMSDTEIINLILKEYGEDNLLMAETATVESKLNESQKLNVSLKTKEKEKNNLLQLLVRARTNKTSLTNWDYFRLKVYQCATNIKKKYPNINATPEQIYDWSMKTFRQESSFKFNAQNPHSSANGLFQAMADTRRDLNMPKNLPLIKQVDYYEQYIYRKINGQKLDVSKISTALDWYLIVFYPNLSDDSDNAVFAKCGGYARKYCIHRKGWKSCNYHANVLYDLNKDGKIFKHEIGKHLFSKY